MGKIKKLIEKELVGGIQSTDVYPVTSTLAVFDKSSKSIDPVIEHVKSTHTFVGVAVPTTIPIVPSNPVFYVAFKAGYYVNFGDIVINETGNVKILMWDNNTWKAIDTVLPINIKDWVQALSNKIDAQKEEVDKAKEDAINAIDSEKQNAISDFNSQRVTPDMLSEATKQYIEASGGGTITNLPDDEDLESKNNVLKLADRVFNSTNFSGKGYKIVRKNIIGNKNIFTGRMISQPDTVYEIRYDFDLNGAEITIPSGCIIDFRGGSLSNGKLIGNGTILYATPYNIFREIELSGTWDIECLYPEYFGAKEGEDATKPIQDSINNCAKIGGGIVKLLGYDYIVTDTLYLRPWVSIIGVNSQPRENNTKRSKLKCNFANTNSWVIDCYYTEDSVNKTYPYNNIFIENNNVSHRTWGVQIKGILIENLGTPIYGGIRCFGTLYSTIENVHVYGTIFGIVSSVVWAFNLKKCFVRSYAYGIGFGPFTTTAKCEDCYLSMIPIDGLVFDDPVLPEGFFPTWRTEKKNYSAFIFNGARVDIYNAIIERYTWLSIGVSYNVSFFNTYLELVRNICWIYNKLPQGPLETRVFFDKSGGGLYNPRLLDSDDFSYGAHNAFISVRQFYSGKCYCDNTSTAYSPIVFEFDSPINGDFFYEDDTMVNKHRKNINLPSHVFIKKAETDNSSNYGIQLYNSGPTNINEICRRYKDVTIQGDSIFKYDSILEGVNFKFRNSVNTAIELEKPIKIKNSIFDIGDKFYFKKTDNFNSHIFDLYNGCTLYLGDTFVNSVNTSQLLKYFRIMEPLTLQMYCKFNVPAYLLESFVANDDIEFTIFVRNLDGELLHTFTNKEGITRNRPKNPRIGQQYFDTTIGKPIWWTGTEWLNY